MNEYYGQNKFLVNILKINPSSKLFLIFIKIQHLNINGHDSLMKATNSIDTFKQFIYLKSVFLLNFELNEKVVIFLGSLKSLKKLNLNNYRIEEDFYCRSIVPILSRLKSLQIDQKHGNDDLIKQLVKLKNKFILFSTLNCDYDILRILLLKTEIYKLEFYNDSCVYSDPFQIVKSFRYLRILSIDSVTDSNYIFYGEIVTQSLLLTYFICGYKMNLEKINEWYINLKKLKSLTLHLSKQIEIDKLILEVCNHCVQLNNFSLNFSVYYSNLIMKSFQPPIRYLRSLSWIKISNLNIQIFKLFLKNNPYLTSLNIVIIGFVSTPMVLDCLSHSKYLRYLILNSVNIFDYDLLNQYCNKQSILLKL